MRLIRILSTLLILGALYSAFVQFATGEEKEKAAYVGAAKCKMCHSAQYKEYEKWSMAKAWESLGDKKSNKECISCHVTGRDKPGGFKSEKDTPAMVNVQCESCHGPGSLHVKAKSAEDRKKSINGRPKEEVCITCHNKKSPNFKEFDFKKAKEQIVHWKKK